MKLPSESVNVYVGVWSHQVLCPSHATIWQVTYFIGVVVIGPQYYLFGIKPFQKHKYIFWKENTKQTQKQNFTE